MVVHLFAKKWITFWARKWFRFWGRLHGLLGRWTIQNPTKCEFVCQRRPTPNGLEFPGQVSDDFLTAFWAKIWPLFWQKNDRFFEGFVDPVLVGFCGPHFRGNHGPGAGTAWDQACTTDTPDQIRTRKNSRFFSKGVILCCFHTIIKNNTHEEIFKNSIGPGADWFKILDVRPKARWVEAF